MVKRLFLLLDAIKFEHSIFALPFAYIGMVMAAGGFPSWDKIIWITVAMVGARTLAMATNRVADAHYDALNPRTAGRAIPKGVLSRWDMVVLAVAGLVVMFFAAWQLNPLCLQLAPLAAVVLIGYSWTKRFTWLSHAVLGLADGCAPAGGWIAVTGTVDLPAVLLGLAVLFWVGGFDLIYACQDVISIVATASPLPLRASASRQRYWLSPTYQPSAVGADRPRAGARVALLDRPCHLRCAFDL